MTTLVVCVDRGTSRPEAGVDDRGTTDPVAGWSAVRSLVVEAGLEDPEDSQVNCLLEALRITRDLRDDGEDAEVAVVAGWGDEVSADRAVARQVDDLIERYDPDSAVVVVDSAEDERLVPIIESRVRIDAVDRVVVRQARDLESTYYLLKQFLADEELRQTVLVPIGAALLVFPALLLIAESPDLAVAAVTAVSGLFLLYKGLSIDFWLGTLASDAKEALYSGQVSIVTYVVAAGLALVGVFAGALGISPPSADAGVLIPAMRFVFEATPWLTVAALTAATGRLVDEVINTGGVRRAFLNLPFGVVAIGLVVRGFSAYFLERAGAIGPLLVPSLTAGPVSVRGFELSTGLRLGAFIVLGLLVVGVGVSVAGYVTRTDPGELSEEFDRSD